MKLVALKPLLILGLILIISLYFNVIQFADNRKLSSDLESCIEIKNSCETTYQTEIKKYNDSQIRASSTIKKLEEKLMEENDFTDCLNMRIPDSFLRVYRGEDSSN